MKEGRFGRASFLAVALVVGACNRGPKGDASLPSGAVRVPNESASPAAPAPARNTVPTLVAGGAPLSLAPIVKAANASVVTITTAVASTGGGMFFGRQSRQSKGLGTGFIVEGDGLIVTNNHVIEGADAVDVQLADEQVFPAKVVGADPVTDLALVRIEGKGLPGVDAICKK